MRSTRCPLIALALVALAASPAFAQFGSAPHSRMFHIGVGGGVSVPTSDAKDFLKNGWNGQAWVSMTPPILPVTLRATFDLQKSDFKTEVPGVGLPSTTPTGTNQVMAGLANARIDLLHGFFVPYVTVGVGGYNLKTESEDPSGTETSESTTRFGINGGAGLQLHIKQIQLYVEGRVDNVYTEKGAIDTKTIQLVPVTVGISY